MFGASENMEKFSARLDIEDKPVDRSKQWSCNCFTRIFKRRNFRKSFVQHGNKTSIHGEHRIFKIDSHSDSANTCFPKNQIRSNKYTVWNFIPKNLFEQFRRVANFYFLVSAIIAMTIDSPISPLTTFLPLLFVILVTAGKQGYEDFLRYQSDSKVNRTQVTVIRNKCMQTIDCEQIVVGDMVKVSRDEDVACDIILFYSSEPNGCCYITTSNLDGETNLKTLQVPKVTLGKSVEEIVAMEALVTCQHPLANLYEFQGKVETNIADDDCAIGSLTIDNILLRGSRLKDTEFVIGASVYTGSDTKLSLNSKMTLNKFSTVEKTINRYLIFLILILLFEILFATLMKVLYEYNESWSNYLGEYTAIGFSKLINDMLSFTILFNYIIPISLYVTVELQKFLGSYFFRWDLDMYDERNDQPALANTSDLNEDLGQIEYLFTDKTGTLTENLMVFRRCSIDGKTYIEKDCNGKLYLLPLDGDEREATKVVNWPSEIWHFMVGITLCHSVHVAPPILMDDIVAKRTAFRQSFRRRSITRVNSSLLMDPKLPEYQAASADEKALVEASARCGVVLTGCNGDEIEIKVGNETLSFTKLDTLEFTSERKRMSVIVQDTAGDVWLYCKGADSEIFPIINEGKISETEFHVADFSKRGLRTLVIAFKKLTMQEYNRFRIIAEQARQTIGIDRNIYVEKAYYLIESKLTLLGATGIEDSLQEGVEETLESLRAAGIKVWVITGDKAETAENIAFSSGHFKSGTEILKLMGQTTLQVCFIALTSFERRLKLEPYKQYGLMMDGASMAVACKRYPELLRMVAMACDAVVCCRMSPLQKSEIVQLIRNSRRRPLTAAIGDGGNDVSMIQEAHVGIGLMGREGRQATMNADFALSKFMYLRKALLALYDSIFLMGFNVAFTSLPVLMFGLMAQDYPATKLLHFPQYYTLNKRNRLLSIHQRFLWLLIAIWQTCIIYFGTYTFWYINPINLWDSTEAGYETYSITIFHLVTIVTNLELLLRNRYWTYPFVISIIFSEIFFFLIAIIYSSIDIQYDEHMYWVFHHLVCSPSFWLLTIVLVPACLLPDCLTAIYDSYRYLDLNYQREREESLQDTCSEWSEHSTEERGFNLTPWRGRFSFTH
ncbi:hypothetical protein PV327_005992 [Microctonus hyperodae]|uniref:Phospholipid-transporting ATPase n=1 Tax=Microctonus hyperodae TaxID=165561 RepID=A0AA39L0B6_MICHY|nr:hypothetical protein PV327_005992 [Microctonus hyperodae]